jgi:hypothetical protein
MHDIFRRGRVADAGSGATIDAMLSRRSLLALAGAGAGYGILHALGRSRLGDLLDASAGYGPLQDDPKGIVRLPKGFSYQALSRTGETMSDGLLVPGAHDAMTTFAGPDGKTIIVRNHELTHIVEGAFGERYEKLTPALRARLYDPGRGITPSLGGTTTLVFDTKTQTLEKHFLSLGGTLRNCAGGRTPWGSWISCEETDVRAQASIERDHGYCFEVPARAEPGLAAPIPLVAMGRCNHEAAAVDPATGIVYLSEDRDDSVLYRFVPKERGKLAGGGRLQALVLRDRLRTDTSNYGDAPRVARGVQLAVAWVDVQEPHSPHDDLRAQAYAKGAARFRRGEGMHYDHGSVWLVCTAGGPSKMGQVWRLRPDGADLGAGDGKAKTTTTLELFYESPGGDVLENADNLTVAPWGDLLICEDGARTECVVGITPEGKAYKLAENVLSEHEVAGATFSPDGSTLFVNIQRPGVTLAITGPWRKGHDKRG